LKRGATGPPLGVPFEQTRSPSPATFVEPFLRSRRSRTRVSDFPRRTFLQVPVFVFPRRTPAGTLVGSENRSDAAGRLQLNSCDFPLFFLFRFSGKYAGVVGLTPRMNWRAVAAPPSPRRGASLSGNRSTILGCCAYLSLFLRGCFLFELAMCLRPDFSLRGTEAASPTMSSRPSTPVGVFRQPTFYYAGCWGTRQPWPAFCFSFSSSPRSQENKSGDTSVNMEQLNALFYRGGAAHCVGQSDRGVQTPDDPFCCRWVCVLLLCLSPPIAAPTAVLFTRTWRI